ncbi:MAG: hypothetical protein H0T91_09385 [Propionibacteriaceae bacterium]|nr:hypothetical protein [Propionibacteriaceae bacterium]
MLDEEYEPKQIAHYGARAQPALVARMRPQLRMTQLGNLVAVLAIATSVGAIYTFPDFTGSRSGSGWAVAALVSSIVLLLICTFQHVAWLRAMAEWKGERDIDLRPLTRVSWVVHLASYAVVLIGLWACIAGSVAAGMSATAAGLLGLTLVFMLAAQILAGVQYLRVSGPPGTIPAHMRRLARRR